MVRTAKSKMASAEVKKNAPSTNLATEFQDLTKTYKCESFSDIAKCFMHLHNEITSEIKLIHSEIASVKSDLSEQKQSLEYTAQEVETVKDDLVKTNTEVKVIREELELQAREILSKDVYGRKWNLIVRGIPGSLGEEANKTGELIRQFAESKLGFSNTEARDMPFAAVHRLPSGQMGKKNIIVRFVRLSDREDFLQKAFSLPKGGGFGVSPDLPPQLARERDRLVKIKKSTSQR